MKQIPIFCLALLLAATGLAAQTTGCEITVRLDFYQYDTLWFGTSFGKRAVPDFPAARQADGSFLLKTDKALEPGMYALVYKRTAQANYQAIQIWLAEGLRKFSIQTSLTVPYEKAVITGSPENELFFKYLKELQVVDKRLDEAIDLWRVHQTEEMWHQRVAVEQEMRQLQDDFLRQNPNSLTAKLVRLTLLPTPTEKPTGDFRLAAAQRWAYQRAHFFDNLDLASANFMRYRQCIDQTDFYLFNLPPAGPDTVKVLIEEVLRNMQPNADAYNYYVKYLINSLEKMSKYRLDEVYVHMVKNYVETGKAVSLTEQERNTVRNNARQMEPLFEGKPAPRATMFDQANNPVELYGIQSNLTLVVFFMPDCGHCKVELPMIAKLYEKYKDSGLKVAAVCLKTGEESNTCWEFGEEHHLPKDWYLLADPGRQAGLVAKFNVRSYPKLFLLDAEKKIAFKRSGEIPEWQLDAILKQKLGK